jgi:aminoglycoside phosphotransferase (APT) family kinase protein
MKSHWQRGADFVKLDIDALDALIQPAFAGQRIEDARPVAGGLSNTNYRLILSGRKAPVRLRIFVTRPQCAQLEVALSKRVHSRVPVPAYLYFASSHPLTGHPYAILEWIDGIPLDSLPAQAGADEVADVGRQVGEILAAIGSFKFPSAGFLSDQLEVSKPMQLGSATFRSYIDGDLLQGQAGARLGGDLTQELRAFVTAASGLLDELEEAPCLVHGDFDGSNILVHKIGDRWKVCGVVDWEYALSATSLVDLGHILRPPLGDIALLERSLIAGFVSHGGILHRQWKRASLLIDLLNWVSFLNRPAPGREVIESAREMIVRTMKLWPREIARAGA